MALPSDPPLDIEAIPWSSLRDRFLTEWEEGQHLSVFGPTGSGKSVVSFDLVEGRADRRRANVVVFASKKRDPTLARLIGAGWPRVREWGEADYEKREHHRLILWPDYGRTSEPMKNRPVFLHALDEIMDEGGWTVVLDEGRYFVEQLKLRTQLDEYWHAARSSGITVVSLSQGITWIPTGMRTEQQWTIFFHIPNPEIALDAGNIAGDRHRFGPIISELGEFEFLIVRTRTGAAYVSKVGT